ncbi:hypothetical protein A3F00_02490 [Candidatus Daviesbacteria bacterium RIFCSPHIGHO2_12_FULL_37_11]|uniref:Glycosyltransferase 2-like domain-containing protein n=1 Tax=Candidatus Daviesbacteria bacterium RIFCSPHIGHO2_12_FULL_37_11 TaxID=1797777 RepID=A0A1F5K8L8_9BACT|nr:MAG: hypothetical protein A2769_01320 [Candidatus Daviesbacteria bacterium RIFCSPHIGHO2_01_FULL_37_27]OGE37249.1 MAG: hypothetical protein A3F00_02490 [Candidatus Daviesbacteria bacterium RIFCSPHIGHO2_12_FULL_37_11]OGE46122.1 MAG: hypothetical protein A3B39_00945 [Candidatus Daviesbacteria bacterium RIFCSPLOWO2_01_FULL_37_10]
MMKSKQSKDNKITVVLPAYNAERTIEKVFKGIPKEISKVILVDDGSKDNTAAVSKKLGIKTIVHKKNSGYGANQKTCYKEALKYDPDFVIMLHPDGQYDPNDLPLFIKSLEDKKGDVILGSRFLSHGDKNTPFYKSISIRGITLLFNLVLGTNLSEANTGYRGYTRQVLEKIPFQKNGNGYIFDPQFLIQAIYFGFKIYDVPVSKAYNPEGISPNFSKSVEHGIENLRLLLEYILHKLKFKKADFLIP